ncbi:putative nucleotidyltransferase with HDIG domain [Granulicella aggregans]|uniref:Putative nucleotidyltransferase with HDIG domain n=1 Tax=Granulicella aggregans TaxID=474949 RepID=A0A7W8E405_9BACT|nr:HD domain-containing protein [Granulicella aggregans]MBB5058518.1 putative nucleotidyltransferase with HDIG domain [Granulicella aggregans]
MMLTATDATFDLDAHHAQTIDMPEIISALSFALDLTEGAVAGHALRSCVLGMRIAAEARLNEFQQSDLYFALLLKDVGCSSNSARMCQIVGGGDDRALKAGVKLEDWTQPGKPKLSTLKLMWNNVLPDGNALERVLRIAQIGRAQHKNNEEMIGLRCDRGAKIVAKIGLGQATAEAVRCLDEHWDGTGYPSGWRGERIPLLARIAAVAQHLDVFATEKGTEQAILVLEERSGKWFDPELVRVAVSLHKRGKLWSNCLAGDSEGTTRDTVLAYQPSDTVPLGADKIDNICEAFSDVVDAKSPFTSRHSMGVAEAALTIANSIGLSADRTKLIHRAALLHDLGKLRVPNSILDKPSKLTNEEFSVVKEHPALTQQILERIPSFRLMAQIAGAHHEKLDGTGYPNHLSAAELSLESRIIAVADVYAALSEERPYRESLDLGQVSAIMRKDIPTKLDPECFEALLTGLQTAKIPA